MSNLIKSFSYTPVEDTKIIEHSDVSSNPLKPASDGGGMTDEELQEVNEILAMREQILQDAEEAAEQHIRQALDEASVIKQQAQAEIDQWWKDKRAKDQQLVDESGKKGYAEGVIQGTIQAEATVKQEYNHLILESKEIIEQSYRIKQEIIQDAEPFLLEVSCAIAQKIMGRQLILNPEWIIETTQKALARIRDKGKVALCVAPQHFAYLQEAKEELSSILDSQAELQILPDTTVKDGGCVIRTEFGSLDARFDTQLREIKEALQHLAKQDERLHDE